MSIVLGKGDCIDKMRGIASGSVQLILTDLPYGVTNCAWDKRVASEMLWPEFARVLAPRGAIVLFAQVPFCAELIRTAPRNWGRYEWIWDKVSVTGAGHAKRQPMRRHEKILVFYRETPHYYPQGLRPCAVKIRRARPSEAYRGFKNASVQRFTGYPTSIIRFPRGNGLQAAEKPVALSSYLIRTYTRPGDTVLDATMGTGSTGVAALRTGRSFVGIEIDRKRFSGALRRLRGEMCAGAEVLWL